jgi:hypothetical protein
LLAEHGVGHHCPCNRQVKAMTGNRVSAIGDDRVSVLHDLQPLEMIGVMQAHALAEDLQNVDDSERPTASACFSRRMVRRPGSRARALPIRWQ